MTSANLNHHIHAEIRGSLACITLNRPQALNALSLEMVRTLLALLRSWQSNPAVQGVAIRGTTKSGSFGGFCAGGDIRFFHQAALAGDPALEDFFTEEYTLNHLIHHYSKPYIAFMDGIVMGGGMGISQGASTRIVTARSKMAMPETGIGLFPDVGGGYFLSRCPGNIGEWLALTGVTIGAAEAMACGLADVLFDEEKLTQAWDSLAEIDLADPLKIERWKATYSIAPSAVSMLDSADIERSFSLHTVKDILESLEASARPWAQQMAQTLRKRSPLMLHVVLEQVRRARSMSLEDDLRMERDLVRHSFFTRHLQRHGVSSETVEGIRALAVDKDHAPQWMPARIEDVTPEMVRPFFDSPWPASLHPLAHLNSA